ncbi:lanthionine synthetase LanC family protein, partial [Nocardia gipuzkoensis]
HLAVARRCADRLIDHTPSRPFPLADDPRPAAGIDASVGMAHGQAGAVAFLLRMSGLGAVPADEPALRHRLADLYRQTRWLLECSTRPTAGHLCVSWCRGLAGIGATLLQSAELRSDSEALELAVAAGTACVGWLPNLAAPGACCGISGVGDFLLRLAAITGEDRFTEAAWSAATHLVGRDIAEGTCYNPPDPADQRSVISWAYGRSGILAFLRRLHTGDKPATVGPF